ncbi:hypothetical protein PsW64_04916 [Pseudovibrio sp. W64]|uniref:hypothetical protein n=1 Tax=Pseudovibrio sp. W64 TaxID=1735583 RepID=UPI0007AE6598|nr:hypothetical protein [Pseudovibrio sp. W64]KZK76199.1 hypothetical protein PsW64_04916 [Pseudovibrio sp. W64]
MKPFLLTSACILAMTIASTSAQALTQRLGPGNRTITFSELSMTDGSPDDGTCEKRYGTDFTTQSNPDSASNPLKRTTKEGHNIEVIALGGNVSEGIFSIENQYEIIFPDDETKTPVDVELAATGLIGSQEASGVFSDGTCRGVIQVKVVSN